MIKAVIFDLDDTLISEKDFIKSGYQYISNELSVKKNINKEKIFTDLMELFNINSKNVFNRLLDKYGIKYSNDMIIELVDKYRCHYPNIKFYDDVIPCLVKLRKLGIKTGIITDGYTVTQRNKLKIVEADKYFDEIIMTDEFGREYWKPNPMAFELMKNKLGIEFNEMVYIGDNPEKDFYISKLYPIKTIRIYRDGVYKDRFYLEEIKEDFNIKNLKTLIEIIRNIL